MDYADLHTLKGFYLNELENNVLSFWLPRCEDKEYGGYLNCFNNSGTELVSYDKYTWSQGRFIWVFSRLACTAADIFTAAQRREFLRLAGQGADFLMEHCLFETNPWKCTFLMERDGTPKPAEPGAVLDRSIYADCFVVGGLAMYAFARRKEKPLRFAQKLFASILRRIDEGDYHTDPYPLSARFRAHGIPMILNNTARELYRASEVLDPAKCAGYRKVMEESAGDVLTHFTDGDGIIHEVITRDNSFFPQILGQHFNPGHTIEDVWFLLDAADICGRPEWKEKILKIAKKDLETGWDKEYGGLLHFSGMHGGKPEGDVTGVEDEPMVRQLSGWDDKLWWIHSEALYTTLRCALEEKDTSFLAWYRKIFAYTFKTFPNPDREVREWIQIRLRDGTPENKVVALPVKDPYHILRNLILITELLERAEKRSGFVS